MKLNNNTIVFPLPSEELLDVVERSLRVSFPETYRRFIQENNGVVPLTNLFSLNQCDYSIERFLCILNNSESDSINGWYDVEVIITQIGERLTDNEDIVGMDVVPIALFGFIRSQRNLLLCYSKSPQIYQPFLICSNKNCYDSTFSDKETGTKIVFRLE